MSLSNFPFWPLELTCSLQEKLQGVEGTCLSNITRKLSEKCRIQVFLPNFGLSLLKVNVMKQTNILKFEELFLFNLLNQIQ